LKAGLLYFLLAGDYGSGVYKTSAEIVRAGVIILCNRKGIKKYAERNIWVKRWVGRREMYGASSSLLKELLKDKFYNVTHATLGFSISLYTEISTIRNVIV